MSIDRFLRKGTYASTLWAHLTAAAIFAGPWILGVCGVLGLQAIGSRTMNRQQLDLFLATITYVYCFSMILTGLTQLVVVRNFSDRLYEGDQAAVAPMYVVANALNVGLHLVVGCAFWLSQPMPAVQKIWSIALFCAVGFSWQAISFLGCLTRHGTVLAAFGAGYAAAVGLGAWLGGRFGLTGLLIGFTTGVLLAFAWVTARLFAEFGPRSDGIRRYLRAPSYLPLVWVGFLWNAGLWADRIVFWVFHPGAARIGPYLSYPPYEQGVFLAYLTVVPAQALLLLRIELIFFRRYSEFHAAVLGHAPLERIQKLRDDVVESLRLSLARVGLVQGVVTMLAILAAPQIIAVLAMPPESIYMFRAAAVGACLNVLLQGVLLVMLYLVLYRQAVIVSALFLLAQTAGALASLKIGFPAYGFGYLAASFVTLCVALPLVTWWVKRLDYYTFGLQPV